MHADAASAAPNRARWRRRQRGWRAEKVQALGFAAAGVWCARAHADARAVMRVRDGRGTVGSKSTAAFSSKRIDRTTCTAARRAAVGSVCSLGGSTRADWRAQRKHKASCSLETDETRLDRRVDEA